MKDLMMLFGVTLAKRYTNRQKRIFYSQLEPFLEKMGYTIKYQQLQKKLIRVKNILIGDIYKAQYVVLCPYDTPSRSLLPYKYYPFNSSKNLQQENKELLLRSLIYIGSCVVAYFVVNQFLMLTTILKIFVIVVLVCLLIFCYQLLMGIANSVNFNRNSASVALLIALAERTKKNTNICYILLDKNVSSNAGLKLLTEDERIKNKIFIYLDCVSYGEELVCAHSQATSSEAKKIISFLSEVAVIDHVFEEERLSETNLKYFPKLLHVCVGSIENRQFLVRNTRSKKDFKVDIHRLETLRKGLLKYLGS